MSWLIKRQNASPGTRERFSISKPPDSRTQVHVVVPRCLRASRNPGSVNWRVVIVIDNWPDVDLVDKWAVERECKLCWSFCEPNLSKRKCRTIKGWHLTLDSGWIRNERNSIKFECVKPQ